MERFQYIFVSERCHYLADAANKVDERIDGYLNAVWNDGRKVQIVSVTPFVHSDANNGTVEFGAVVLFEEEEQPPQSEEAASCSPDK